MWLKFGVLSRGLFSHLKVEKMRVEVENKIWIKTKIVTTFFSKKTIGIFKRKDLQTNNLAKGGRKDFFLHFQYFL